MKESSAEAKLRDYCARRDVSYTELLKRNGLIHFTAENDPWNRAVKAALIADQWNRNRYLLAAMEELEALCEENGIDHVFLKGLPVGQELYDSKELRITGDVDILVKYRDAALLAERMREKGFSFSDEGLSADKAMERVRNCHHHLRAMGKTYELRGNASCAEVEIHVFPFARGYDLLGHTRTDLTYTDAVLARKRTVGVEGKPFPAPSVTDGLLILSMHMISHMCLDLVLFLYAGKPFRYQNPLPMLIDTAKYAEKHGRAVDREELAAASRRLGHEYELLLAGRMLKQFFEIDLFDGKEFVPASRPSTPLAVVCALLLEMDASVYLFSDPLKGELSSAAMRHVRSSAGTLDAAGVRAAWDKDHVSATFREAARRRLLEIDFYSIENGNDLRTDSFVIDADEKRVRFLRDDGFGRIWAPGSYGQYGESELQYCYTVLESADRNGRDTSFPWPSDVKERLRASSVKVVMKPVDGFNPFLNKAYLG